ncbi:MAG: hypothetical protein H0W63_08340 [Gemmatimonadaceae bacterium]|nr:hypothetical protein [Gemmatimonadaceae bacterium]
MPPYLVAATVEGILAQRLIRLLCAECSEAYVPEAGDVEAAPPRDEGVPARYRRAKGCPSCDNTGYRGRVGIYELLIVTDDIRHLIARDAPLAELRAAAAKSRMATLNAAAWEAASEGRTSIAEVTRVLGAGVEI